MASSDSETPQYTLKEREYIGDDGEIHHHTHVWMAENVGPPKSQSGSSSTRSSSSSSRSSSGSNGSSSGSGSSPSNRGSGSQSRGGGSGSSSQGGSASSRSGSSGGGSKSSGSGSKSSGSSRSGSSRRSDRESEAMYGEEGGGMRKALLATAVGVAAITAAVVVGRRRTGQRGEREGMEAGASGRQRLDADTGLDHAQTDRERFENARDSDRARGLY